MEVIKLLTLVVGFLTLIGPTIVLNKNTASKKSKLLLLMAIVTGPLWAISIFIFFHTGNLDFARIALNLIYSVSVLTAILTFFFTKMFPYRTQSRFYELFLLFIPAMIILYEVWFTNYFIVSIGTDKIPLFGDSYIFWVFWFAYTIGSRIYYLGRNLGSITEIERRQSIYLVVGLSIAGLGMTPTNIILPYFGVYEYIWIGPIMGFFMIAFISYSVITLRFGTFKTLLAKAFEFVRYAILPSFIVASLLMLVFNLVISLQNLLVLTLTSLFSFYIILYFRNKVQNDLDPTEDFSTRMSTVLGLEDISKEISTFMLTAINPKYFNILIFDKFGDTLYSSLKKESKTIEFPMLDVISYGSYYQEIEKIVVLQELRHLQVSSIEEQNIWRYKRFLSLIEYMQKLNVDIIVPISLRNESQAFLILGSKGGEEMYIAEDLSFLNKIKNTIKVLLERAILYQEVQSFNETLQNQVEEKTKELGIKVKQLEEARRKENDMIDIMGHELRTPATVVKLNIELLKKYIDSNPEEFKKYIDRIGNAVDTEIGLINTLLTSAKLEGNKVEIKHNKVDVKEEIEMSIHGHEKEIREGVSINKNIERNLPYAYADKVRVAEVLNNLMSNAIKYTEKGNISVIASSKGDYIVVSIKDTGKGISKEDMKKLGEKFYRVDNYLESEIVRPGGTGLGLYVTFGLVKLMGGKIEVESTQGVGSKFTFTLPKYKGQQVEVLGTVNRFEKLGLKKS